MQLSISKWFFSKMEWFDVDTWKTTWTTFTTSNNASRGHIASSRPMLTKGCCKGNNYEQRFALDTFPADFSWRNVLAKPCILLFTLQQDCYTRIACRLLLVVKVVFVVFPNSAGRIGNSTNPITRFSGWTEEHAFWCVSWARIPFIKIILRFVFKKVAKDLVVSKKRC